VLRFGAGCGANTAPSFSAEGAFCELCYVDPAALPARDANSVAPLKRQSILRRLLIIAGDAVIILYLFLDGIVAPIFGPLAHFAARLRLVVRLQQAVAALPPYLILALVGVPIMIAEPAKLYALWLMSAGLFWKGAATLLAAYVLSLLIAERIYQAGRAKLRTIAWFARLMDWIISIREHILSLVRGSAIWTHWMKIKRRSRDMAARFRLYFHIG
jgi:hypothetical protein